MDWRFAFGVRFATVSPLKIQSHPKANNDPYMGG
jgi:hypothetical protein